MFVSVSDNDIDGFACEKFDWHLASKCANFLDEFLFAVPMWLDAYFSFVNTRIDDKSTFRTMLRCASHCLGELGLLQELATCGHP